MFFVVFALQIAADGEVAVKIVSKSLIKNVQVSLYNVVLVMFFYSEFSEFEI